MQLIKVAMLTGIVLGLNGCALLDRVKDVFDSDEQKTTATPQVSTKSESTTKTNKTKKASQTKKAKGVKDESAKNDVISSEDIIEENNDNIEYTAKTPAVNNVTGCQFSAESIDETLTQMTRLALRSCLPKQPNVTLVRNISVSGNSCGSNPTNTVKDVLSNSAKFTLANANLTKRIESQLHNASNSYMIRVAKSQNINYIVSGNVNANNGLATLKIIDVSTGAILWQNSANIK